MNLEQVKVIPLMHVPDVQAAVEWYEGIGFDVIDTNVRDGEMNWAFMRFGEGSVMFNAGGRPATTADRREVDVYLVVHGVEAHCERLKNRVDFVKSLHETFYGTREFIVRDLNGFWITFGESLSRQADSECR